MKNEIELQKTFWASVSGGKDSLYMLAHILNNLDKYPLDGVVHFELEIDYPFIKNVIDYMERRCKQYGIPFLRIKPSISWYDLKDKYMVAHRVSRWCNTKYKLDCRKQLDVMMKNQNKLVIMYIGLCANETKRVKDDPQTIYPLVECGVYESTIWEWARNQPLFNDYYKYNKRCGCMFCPCATIQEHRYLYTYYPKEFNYYMNECKIFEEEMKARKGFEKWSFWSTNTKYDTGYRINKVKETELKEIERW